MDVRQNELPAKECICRGAACFRSPAELARRLGAEFGGALSFSFYGGPSFTNRSLLEAGIRPVNMATNFSSPAATTAVPDRRGVGELRRPRRGGPCKGRAIAPARCRIPGTASL